MRSWLAVLLVLLPGGSVLADETSLFRALFHYHGVKPIDLDAVNGQAQLRDTIIVVYGRPPDDSPAASIVRKALRTGGSVLIVCEVQLNLRRFLPDDSNIAITGEHTRRLKHFLTLNSPYNRQGLSVTLMSVSRLSLVPSEYIQHSDSIDSEADQPDFLAYGQSRITGGNLTILSSEPTLYTSVMLTPVAPNRPQLPDNFRFGDHLVRRAIGPERRSKCLFLFHGSVIEKFDDISLQELKTELPEDLPMDLPLPPLLDREFQQGLAGLIDESLEKLEGSLDPVPDRSPTMARVLGAIIIVFMFLAMAYAGQRIIRANSRWDARILPNDPYRLGTDIPFGSLAHRRRELMRRPDLREPFVDTMRRLFVSRGYTGGFEPGVRMPRIVNNSKRVRLPEMISVLWEEAVKHARRPLLYTRMVDIHPIIAIVRSAAEADLWRFDSDPDAAA